MQDASFLTRKTLGQPNYLVIAMVVAFAAALVPRAVQLAVEASTSSLQTWTPAGANALANAAWVEQQFPAATVVEPVQLDSRGRLRLWLSLGLAGLASFAAGYVCLRSALLAGVVLAAGVLSAGASVAIVFYCGVMGLAPTAADAMVLATVALVAHAVGLSGAIVLVNRYRATRSADAAAQVAWPPSLVATAAIAVVFAPLVLSNISALQTLGVFAIVAVLVGVTLAFAIVPVLLHCLATPVPVSRHTPAWAERLVRAIVQRPTLTSAVVLVALAACAGGTTRLETNLRPESLASVPPVSRTLELVVTVPTAQLPPTAASPEQSDRHRMDIAQRVALVRDLEIRLATVPGVDEIQSAAAHVAGREDAVEASDFDAKFRRWEASTEVGKAKTRRELWRISAVVAADADPRAVMQAVREAVEPVLLAHEQRNHIVAELSKAGKQLADSRLCILFRTPTDRGPVPLADQEAVLATLLQRSGLVPKTQPDGTVVKALSSFNLAMLDARADDAAYLESAIKAITAQDALVLVSAGSDPTARQLAAGGMTVIDVSRLSAENAASEIGVTYGGTAPLAVAVESHVPASLRQCVPWMALLAAGVLAVWLAHPVTGLAAAAPLGLTVVAAFGVLGLSGVPLSGGAVAAGVAAAVVAVYGTIQLLSAYQIEAQRETDRQQAAVAAWRECAPAIAQTAVVMALGLAALALSGIGLLQRVGWSAAPMLAVVAVAQLVLLPALLATGWGRLLAATSAATGPAQLPKWQPTTELAEAYLGPAPHIEFVDDLPVPVPELQQETEPLLEMAPQQQPEPEFVAVHASRYEVTKQEQAELLSGPHAALRAKLRSLRRELPQDGVST